MEVNDEETKKALEDFYHRAENTNLSYHIFENERKALKDALAIINRQQERIEELEIITGLANNRKYYRKFVDEVFCKQKGRELSEPDFDYIYQLYFEQQAKIEKLIWEKNHFEFKVEDLNGKLEKFKEYRDIKYKADEREIEKLQAEIERLQAENKRLESLLNQLFKDVDYKLQYIYELEKKLESD